MLIAAALAVTIAMASACVLAGVVAMLPNGIISHGVTGRVRLELYAGSVLCLALMSRVWFTAGGIA